MNLGLVTSQYILCDQCSFPLLSHTIKSKILGKPLDSLTLLLEYSCSGGSQQGAVIALNPCSLPLKIFSAACLLCRKYLCLLPVWRHCFVFSDLVFGFSQWLHYVNNGFSGSFREPWGWVSFSLIGCCFLRLAAPPSNVPGTGSSAVSCLPKYQTLENILGLLKHIFIPGHSWSALSTHLILLIL